MYELLVVEDDVELAQAVADFLKDLAQVTICHDGLTGLAKAQTGLFDVVVLDIMLPGLDGLSVLAALRKKQIYTPVLLLTAKDQLQDKVEGFEKGADDYLTKPFFREELVLRIKAILKRTKGLQEEEFLQAGDLKVNLGTRQVFYQQTAIELQGKEFDLLVYLMENKGRILTKEQIFDRIWGFQSVTTLSVVEVYLSNLRKKLRSVGIEDWIKTLRNVGYQFQKVEHN